MPSLSGNGSCGTRSWPRACSSPRGSQVEFAHQSFAEYLAARDPARTFDEALWRHEMIDPNTRSFALFTLALASLPQPVDDLLVRLLDGPDADPVAAGDVLADGIPARAALRSRTLAVLLDRLTDNHSTAPECLRVLGELVGDTDVRESLGDVAANTTQSAWLRAVVADALADAEPDEGIPLLRELLRDRTARHEVRRWVTRRLAVHGDPVGLHLTGWSPHENWNGSEGSILSREALVGAARDPEAPDDVRLGAARALFIEGDDEGREALRELTRDPACAGHTAMEAAQSLAEAGDEIGIATLERELRVRSRPPGLRLSYAKPLLDCGSRFARDLVLSDAQDATLTPRDRQRAAEELAKRGDPDGMRLVRPFLSSGNAPGSRYTAAVTLAEHGDTEALDTLREMSGDATLSVLRRIEAADALSRLGVEVGMEGLLAEAASDIRRGDVLLGARTVVALVDIRHPRVAEVLASLTNDDAVQLETRADIARQLAVRGNTVGLPLLRQVAVDPHQNVDVRIQAAIALDEDDPASGSEALRDLVRDTTVVGSRLLAVAKVLAASGDSTGADILHRLAMGLLLPTSLRMEAAEALVEAGDPRGVQILHRIDRSRWARWRAQREDQLP
ncbi:HEAT repeat domain-containing protein [Streptomyces sp. NPDC055642]